MFVLLRNSYCSTTKVENKFFYNLYSYGWSSGERGNRNLTSRFNPRNCNVGIISNKIVTQYNLRPSQLPKIILLFYIILYSHQYYKQDSTDFSGIYFCFLYSKNKRVIFSKNIQLYSYNCKNFSFYLTSSDSSLGLSHR